MSMALPEIGDEIGPERIYLWRDPEIGVRGVVVIDTTVFGSADGGTRMLPDITIGEIAGLSRTMTYKFASFEIPLGGAKSGIWADPRISGSQREAVFQAYGRAMAPLLNSRVLFSTGSDMGTNYDDLKVAFRASGRLALGREPEIDGHPVTDMATGYGVAVGAQEACRFAGIDFHGATTAIEGLGKVGGAALKYLAEMGTKIVAVSTINGCIYDPGGLDLTMLLRERESCGDSCVLTYSGARRLPKEEIFGLPVDILIPGARPGAINSATVGGIKARIISSGANMPITDEAEDELFRRKVVSVPDFIANAGGVISGLILMFGGGAEEAMRGVKKMISGAVSENLATSASENSCPRSLAVRKAKARVLAARKERTQIPFVELRKMLMKRVQGF